MLRQSRTLARPAAPLATGVMKISSVDKTIKKLFVTATAFDGSKHYFQPYLQQ